MLQCKFYFLFIELFDAGNGIGCIRHQRVAGNIIDPVSCGKGVKAEGLGMHEPDGDFVGGRPVYNAQVGSMNINGVVMGGSQHAILDDDFPRHPEKCRLSAQEELVRRERGRGAIFKWLNMMFSQNWETTPMPCI